MLHCYSSSFLTASSSPIKRSTSCSPSECLMALSPCATVIRAFLALTSTVMCSSDAAVPGARRLRPRLLGTGQDEGLVQSLSRQRLAASRWLAQLAGILCAPICVVPDRKPRWMPRPWSPSRRTRQRTSSLDYSWLYIRTESYPLSRTASNLAGPENGTHGYQ